MTEEAPWGELRSPTTDDIEGVVELFNARASALGSQTRSTLGAIEAWWTSRDVNLSSDMRVASDDGRRIVGFASVERPSEPFVAVTCGASVHPDVCSRPALRDELFAWIDRRARAFVPLAPATAQVSLFTESLEADAARKGAIARAGFAPARIFFRMRIHLDAERLPFPERLTGIAIRRMEGEELLRVAEVHEEAFRDHWGHTEEPPEVFVREWLEETRGQAGGFSFVAEADGAIVGYILCQDRYRGDTATGYVAYVGVRPAWRKRGIALTLLQTAFRTFAAREYTAARLGVDADSPTGATRLYERAGMHVVEQVNRYERVLRPGADLVSRPTA